MKDFGGVAEAVIADRQPGQQVLRQMVDEDQPQRQAAKQVKAQFAFGARDRKRNSRRRRRSIRRALHRACASGAGNLVGNRCHIAQPKNSLSCAFVLRG